RRQGVVYPHPHHRRPCVPFLWISSLDLYGSDARGVPNDFERGHPDHKARFPPLRVGHEWMWTFYSGSKHQGILFRQDVVHAVEVVAACRRSEHFVTRASMRSPYVLSRISSGVAWASPWDSKRRAH